MLIHVLPRVQSLPAQRLASRDAPVNLLEQPREGGLALVVGEGVVSLIPLELKFPRPRIQLPDIDLARRMRLVLVGHRSGAVEVDARFALCRHLLHRSPQRQMQHGRCKDDDEGAERRDEQTVPARRRRGEVVGVRDWIELVVMLGFL